jgi:hypothetical protein
LFLSSSIDHTTPTPRHTSVDVVADALRGVLPPPARGDAGDNAACGVSVALCGAAGVADAGDDVGARRGDDDGECARGDVAIAAVNEDAVVLVATPLESPSNGAISMRDSRRKLPARARVPEGVGIDVDVLVLVLADVGDVVTGKVIATITNVMR